MTKLHTYLNFAGNTEEAFSFYRSVFGGDFASLVRFKDFPMEGVSIPKEDENKIMHVALPIGEDNILMATDTLGSLGQELVQGNNVYISVHPSSKEEADRVFNSLSEGGEIEMPIADQAWGDYYGSFKDKFGVMWMVNYSPAQEAEGRRGDAGRSRSIVVAVPRRGPSSRWRRRKIEAGMVRVAWIDTTSRTASQDDRRDGRAS